MRGLSLSVLFHAPVFLDVLDLDRRGEAGEMERRHGGGVAREADDRRARPGDARRRGRARGEVTVQTLTGVFFNWFCLMGVLRI